MVFEVADHEFELKFHYLVLKAGFFLMVVITRFVKNEFRYNEIMKFKFKFEIIDLENLGLSQILYKTK